MHTCFERGGRYAAVELTSEALAQGFAEAWQCNVGVFTNLTHDHLDAHGSAEHYLASKAQLFVSLPAGATAVLNAGDPVFDLLSEVMPAGVKVLSYAVPSRGPVQGTPDLVARSVDVSWSGTTIACDVRDPASGLPSEVRVRAIGDVYAENALAALLGAVAAGVPAADACAALAEAPPPPGRFEVVHERPYVVVDYAHSPDALARTVQTARKLADRSGGKLTVVFGAGGKRDKAKRGPMGEAARSADRVILTTDNPRDEDPAVIARAIAEGLHGHASVTHRARPSQRDHGCDRRGGRGRRRPDRRQGPRDGAGRRRRGAPLLRRRRREERPVREVALFARTFASSLGLPEELCFECRVDGSGSGGLQRDARTAASGEPAGSPG